MAEHEPSDTSRRQVEAMAAYGVTQDDIARVLGISPKTLRAHYDYQLDTGTTKANAAIAGKLYNIAMGNDKKATPRDQVTACIFWLKTRAGWSEYSPGPDKPTKPLGKKEQADIAAATASEGTPWEKLVH